MGPRSAAPLSRKGPHWQPLCALQSHIRPSFYPPLLREAFSSEGLHLGRQRLGCERPRRHRWLPFWSPPAPGQKYRYGGGRASGQRPVSRMGEFPMEPAPKVLPRLTLSARVTGQCTSFVSLRRCTSARGPRLISISPSCAVWFACHRCQFRLCWRNPSGS